VKIYVASSWRNKRQPNIVSLLREHKHDVYDFRNSREGGMGFHWSEIDPNWKNWTKEQYRERLSYLIAESGYQKDMWAMMWADVFVGVMPFGRSASMEMGWAAGRGKITALLLHDGEPELMVKMFDYICCDERELLEALNQRGAITYRDVSKE